MVNLFVSSPGGAGILLLFIAGAFGSVYLFQKLPALRVHRALNELVRRSLNGKSGDTAGCRKLAVDVLNAVRLDDEEACHALTAADYQRIGEVLLNNCADAYCQLVLAWALISVRSIPDERVVQRLLHLLEKKRNPGAQVKFLVGGNGTRDRVMAALNSPQTADSIGRFLRDHPDFSFEKFFDVLAVVEFYTLKHQHQTPVREESSPALTDSRPALLG